MVSVAALVLLATAATRAAEDQGDKIIRESVLRLSATQRGPQYLQPWRRANPQPVTGSATVIDGQRILTNAHLVMYASEIYVQPYQSADRTPAKVAALAPGLDLALLEVGDKDFFKGRPGLKMSPDLPQVKDVVSAYGYPVGGVDMSITKGAVARIEYAMLSNARGLRIEVDAAIGPGSSGGPAIVDGRMIGVVFGMSLLEQKIGFVIPTEEIVAFLGNIRGGKYEGKLQMWDELQTLENDALRAKLQIDKATTGVLVHKPHAAAADYPLKKGDIITRIHDYTIDNSGMVLVKENLRLPFSYLVPKLAQDNRIRLTILRQGETRTIVLPVSAREGDYLLQPLEGRYPSYFVWGPLVFSPATGDLVEALAPYVSQHWSSHDSPLILRQNELAAFAGEEFVMICTMLPHKTSKGYGSPAGRVVATINGVPIRNLRHLVETLRDSTAQFMEFEVAGRYGETLVFDRQEVLDSMEDILADNGIRQQSSDDLRGAWQKKP